MLMDELGSSIEDLFQECKRKLDVGTVCQIAVQLLKRVEAIHSVGIIHRDLKPGNFLVGTSEATKNNIYVRDFGLSKYYKDAKGKHIPEKTNKAVTGTPRYASLRTMMGYEQSRRDDLEQVAFTLIYLAEGKLPWQCLPGKTKDEKNRMIRKKK